MKAFSLISASCERKFLHRSTRLSQAVAVDLVMSTLPMQHLAGTLCVLTVCTMSARSSPACYCRAETGRRELCFTNEASAPAVRTDESGFA